MTSRIPQSWLLAAAVALAFAAPGAYAGKREIRDAEPTAAAPEVSPRVPRISDLRTVDIRLDGGSNGLAANESATIRTADAAFIKVHIDNFNLPRGVTLEVSSLDGKEVYRYSANKRDGFTVDRSLGQNGTTSFSSMSITGTSAVLRLKGKPEEKWAPGQGVTVTRYTEGYPSEMLKGLLNDGLLTADPAESAKAICGADDKKGVACYSSTDTAAYDRSRPVGKLILGSGGACTAWRVGPNNHLFTNNHCFTTTSEVAASEVWFNYQATACGGSTGATVTKVPGATMLKTDSTLDYTLFTVNNFSTISSFGYFGLDVRTPTSGEEIFIPQHPGGRMKELGVVSDQNGGGRCKIDAATTNGNGTNTDSGYYCDTEPGSSGSPVVARSTNKVIALHHLGGCLNTGAQITQIWPQVSSFFGGVIPSGDNGGTPTNSPPIANYTFTTSGLTATFTDASTDSDGSIASRSWNFGDGTSSTAINPSHTYAASGTYSVTLTVTDNGGTTAATTKSVAVSGGTQPPGNLTNGVPVSNLSAAAGGTLTFTMQIPTDTPISNLKFAITGGTGDADLYVKYGSAPTTTVYDCRPYLSGNNETCNIATAQAGTYYVVLRAYSAFSGVSLTGSYTAGGRYFENQTDFAITDNSTVESPIAVSGVSGNAPSTLKVGVTIYHTYQGDLKVDLIAPNGAIAATLWNHTGAGTDNIIQTFTVNASAYAANGTWKLRVNDNATQDTGRIDKWSLQF